jgi:hypothetical protein
MSVSQPASSNETPPTVAEAARSAETNDEAIGVPPAAGRHPLTRRAVWLPLALLLAVLNVPFFHYALRGEARTTTTVPFADDFERPVTALGEHYFATGADWRIQDGWLYSPGARNNPLWLRAPLPRDVVVEFDVRADGPGGDLKCEIFGNGRDHASGYVLIFGGWSNTVSTIARLDEHGRDRLERKDRTVERGKTYHFRIRREGRRLEWSIDGETFLAWDDAAPLAGPGHDRFAFSSWASDVSFDNLSVRPL